MIVRKHQGPSKSNKIRTCDTCATCCGPRRNREPRKIQTQQYVPQKRSEDKAASFGAIGEPRNCQCKDCGLQRGCCQKANCGAPRESPGRIQQKCIDINLGDLGLRDENEIHLHLNHCLNPNGKPAKPTRSDKNPPPITCSSQDMEVLRSLLRALKYLESKGVLEPSPRSHDEARKA